MMESILWHMATKILCSCLKILVIVGHFFKSIGYYFKSIGYSF